MNILSHFLSTRNLPDVTAEDFSKVDLRQFKWIHWEVSEINVCFILNNLIRVRNLSSPDGTRPVEPRRKRLQFDLDVTMSSCIGH